MDRLSPSAGDAVFWLGLAAAAAGLVTVALLPVVTVAGVALALLLVRGARLAAAVGLLALVAGGVRAASLVRAHEARVGSLSGPWPAACVVTGKVTRSPVLAGGALRTEVAARSVRCRDGPELGPTKVALYVPYAASADAGALARGDDLVVTASLAPPYRFWNDGTGDPRPRMARRGVLLSGGASDVVALNRGAGVTTLIDRARSFLRARIVATFPDETAPMARALVLGEDDLPADDDQSFRRSGLAHLLAVSGMHLVLVVLGFSRAVRALLARTSLAARLDVARPASLAALGLAWVYADLAGGSGSALRAAWMCSFALAGRVLGRRASRWRSLGLSLLAMALVDPLVAFDVSFVLSALATLGIVTLGRRIAAAAPGPRALRGAVATTLAATIACGPVLATLAPELPLGGLVANLVAVPIGEAMALPLCLAHALASPWPAVERGCAVAASGALLGVRFVARLFARTAVPVPPPTAEELALLAAVAVGCALASPRRRTALLAGFAVLLPVLELGARRAGAPKGLLRATFLDVGQGDAALVDLPDGSALLLDGGGLVGSPFDVGDRVVRPVLAARRRAELAAVVLSHPHPDHFLGLGAALTGVRPRAFWDTGQGEAEGAGPAYASLLADLRRRGTPVLRPGELCGTRSIGGALVDVLAPCPGSSPDRGPNDNSFVVRIRFGRRAILFAGDAERAEEGELLRLEPARLRADVLKVGHHGSRTSSTPAFVAAVAPAAAVVSCGVRNRFGHPNAETLHTLAEAGAAVFRTDRDGSVIVTTDGDALSVRTAAGRVDQVRSTTPMYGRLR